MIFDIKRNYSIVFNIISNHSFKQENKYTSMTLFRLSIHVITMYLRHNSLAIKCFDISKGHAHSLLLSLLKS